jgi:hypothetical protein
MMSQATEATESTVSLRSLRGSFNLSAREVAEKVAEILGEESRTGESIAMIERRGTKDHYVISALAQIFGVTTDRMATITRPRSP